MVYTGSVNILYTRCPLSLCALHVCVQVDLRALEFFRSTPFTVTLICISLVLCACYCVHLSSLSLMTGRLADLRFCSATRFLLLYILHQSTAFDVCSPVTILDFFPICPHHRRSA